MSPGDLFGRELLRLRLSRGLSLRRLARTVGMSAHSALVDYERGRRIPPADLMDALVRALRPDDDRLRVLYEAALAGRATAVLEARDRPRWPAQGGHTDPEYRCPRCQVVLAVAVSSLEEALMALAALRGTHAPAPGDPTSGAGARVR